MEDLKLKEHSKEFLLDNVVFISCNIKGELFHTFKNGRTRKIFLFQLLVKIINSDGNELYSKILDDNHPLIRCANLYYKFRYLVKSHSKDFYTRTKMLEGEKKQVLSQIEEIYQLY